jgi:SAM-dependent methyltransferase
MPSGILTEIGTEMRAMPGLDRTRLNESSLEVSLLIPARGAETSLEETVRQAHAYLSDAFKDRFEIILIPNPPLYPKPGAAPDRSIEVSEHLARRYPSEVRVAVHRLPQGKGAALRTGFMASSGRTVLFTDADLPYRLDFFSEATHALNSGFDLVTGNRRLDESVFDMPVGLLKLAYRRHRLGLLFNRVARLLMRLPTTDTQAGIKAMSRRLATEAFSRQRCPGFFFDLELFLTARAEGWRHTELPVTLFLNSEKSTVRVLRESWLAAFWLLRISLTDRLKKSYGRPRIAPGERRVPSRYRGTRLGTRLFLEARWRLTPYQVMASRLPPRGRILDLGCGHGLFGLALALGSSEREVIGLDHDEERIAMAEGAAKGLPNLKFTRGTLSDPEQTGRTSQMAANQGISMIDVMHYFGPSEQERLFRQAFELLAPGGTLIVREVDPAKGLVSSFNRFYEKIATTTGFTRSEQKQSLHFRTREDWEEALRRTGFKVTSERCSHALFADILYVCRKPSRPRELDGERE